MDNMQNNSTKNNNGWQSRIFSCLIVLIMISGASYYFYSIFLQNPCGVPVKYSIGNIDPRFKITSDEVLKTTVDAANRWNAQTGEAVLFYDPNAKLKLNLIYDERQAKIDKISSEIGTLDSSGNAIESLRTKIESSISQYRKDLASYNSKVSRWNSQGGAPADVFSQLENQQNDLETRRISINRSADLLSKQIDGHNSNLDQLNSEINSEKNKIITQGMYFPSDVKIDIYTFGNKDELRLVAMHELGHALTLGHDTQIKSILYPILGNQDLANPTLTDEDLQIFKSNCKSPIGTLENMIKNYRSRFVPQSGTQ